MFYIHYTSDDTIINNELSVDTVKCSNIKPIIECLICLHKSSQHNIVLHLQDFLMFDFYCDCNATFHEDCLFIWLRTNNNNCPICRKNISIKNIVTHLSLYTNTNTNTNVKLYNYYLYIIKVSNIISLFNTLLIIVYIYYYL